MQNYEKLQNACPNENTAILLCSPINQLYATGFDYSDGFSVVTKSATYLITDFRYIEAAQKNTSSGVTVVLFKGLSDGKISEIFEKHGISTCLFDDNYTTYAMFEKLKNTFQNINFLPADSLVEDIREFKNEYELECVIKAQRIAEKAFDRLLLDLSPSMTEKEASAHLEYLMRTYGADGISFDTIAVSGSQSSLPHGVPRDTKIEQGFMTFDFGAVYRGYHSDMTRTVCIGKADSDMKKIYSTVLISQQAALDAIMNGERNCFVIDKISRDIIYNAGYTGCFGHGLGHGVGLEIHEAPRLSPSANKDKFLSHGHIVTVEPGIYIAGKYGVRIEDMVYIGENNAKNLTKTPKNLIEILF